MATEIKVGERIKLFRKNLGMSISDLARHSGVEIEVIAAIEDGDVLPALGILTKLSRALGQRLGTFMDDQFKPDPIITRAADLAKVEKTHQAASDYQYHSLAVGKPDRHMDPFFIELPPTATDKLSSHEGEELIVCVSGEVEIIYGESRFVLSKGDTAYYNSVVKHAVNAVGGNGATIYGVVFMPI